MKHRLGMKDPVNQQFNAEVEPRSQRSRILKSFGSNFVAYALESEAQTFKKAMSATKVQMWKEAVNNKIKSILRNHT